MIIRQANTILVAERERYSVLVVFFAFVFHTCFLKGMELSVQQNLATSKIRGLKLSVVIANVKSNLSIALEGLDSKDSWSVAIFYFK